MKITRKIPVLLLLFALLAVTASSALAADISLLGVDFISGKGLVLYFNVGADFDASQAGSVEVDGVSYPLSCHFNDHGALVCIAAITKSVTGSAVIVTLGGASFDIVVPQANVPAVSNPACAYIYNVIDYGPDDETPWHTFDTFAQCTPAEFGDMLVDYYNPEYDDTYDYIFSELGGDCGEGDPELGNGYYYDCDD